MLYCEKLTDFLAPSICSAYNSVFVKTFENCMNRNNICEKLQTRSVGKLTIYAVLSGIVSIKEI